MLHFIRLERNSITFPKVTYLNFIIWVSLFIWSCNFNNLIFGTKTAAAAFFGLRSQICFNLISRVIYDGQVFVSHFFFKHKNLVEYVVTFPIFTFAWVHEVFVIFWVGTLILMRQQFSQEVISSRCHTSLNQTFVLITFDKWRNTKIQNENIDKLFHIYFKNAISVFSWVVIHVGDVDCPISEIDEALLLLCEFIWFYIGQLDELRSGIFCCESYVLGPFSCKSIFIEAKLDLGCDESISDYVFLSG